MFILYRKIPSFFMRSHILSYLTYIVKEIIEFRNFYGSLIILFLDKAKIAYRQELFHYFSLQVFLNDE